VRTVEVSGNKENKEFYFSFFHIWNTVFNKSYKFRSLSAIKKMLTDNYIGPVPRWLSCTYCSSSSCPQFTTGRLRLPDNNIVYCLHIFHDPSYWDCLPKWLSYSWIDFCLKSLTFYTFHGFWLLHTKNHGI